MARGTKPVLVIHGGAGSTGVSGEKYQVYRSSLEEVIGKSFAVLSKGGSALDAVLLAVELLENDPLYNAGKGSKIQSDGRIRMSAALMDGDQRRFSGCVNVEGVKNPIRLAELLLSKEDRVLSGAGARKFARENGIPFSSPMTPKARRDYQKKLRGKSGTVGAVALDRKGRLAAATSTGGRGFEYPFRVSDSPTVAGNFANRHAAVSATGTGERIVEFGVASSLCALAEAGHSLRTMANRLISKAKKAEAEFGLIGVNAKGQIVTPTSTDLLIWASGTNSGFDFFPPQS